MPDIYAPAPFSDILNKSLSVSPTLATAITNRNRYMFVVDSKYLSISSSYEISFDTNLSTYNDHLTKIFQLVQESSSNPTNYRIDSELHSLESLDYDSTSQTLKFKNNWGINATSNTGYICFSYDTSSKKLKAKTRYIFNSDYSHSIDSSFSLADSYVYLENNTLKLTSSSNNATSITVYNSPINVSIPSNFNPIPIAYQTNARVSLSSNDLRVSTQTFINSIPGDPYNNFQKNFTNTSTSGYDYTLQISSSGSNDTTSTYASTMLTEIVDKVTGQGNSLRYTIDTYKTFRNAALNTILKSNSIANGSLGMNTTPYVYFTNEKDDSGKYHPFMCLTTYSIADKPNRLLDVARPPGGSDTGGYAEQDVTRDAALQAYLFKIPMLDYGLVDDINGGLTTTNGNLVSSISGTYNAMLNTLAYDYIDEPTPNGNLNTTNLTYNVYNYTSTSGIGVAIDGVAIYPILNNTLNSAATAAEITNTGIHVGRGMGLHYHADGHSADANSNNLNLYNSFDYTSKSHPPLIGFGLDGIALYGINDSTADGYSTDLDSFGGHTHEGYGYHYHSHKIENTSNNNISIGNAATYTVHALMNGAWKGNINSIPDFWNILSETPEYSVSQGSKYVWGTQLNSNPPTETAPATALPTTAATTTAATTAATTTTTTAATTAATTTTTAATTTAATTTALKTELYVEAGGSFTDTDGKIKYIWKVMAKTV